MKKIFSFILALTAAVAVNATIVEKTVAQLKTANNWANGTKYTSVNLDENISVKILNGGGNSGKYYDLGSQWRLYQAETPNLNIIAAQGFTITAISISYVMEKTGILVDPAGEWYESATYFVPAEPNDTLIFTVANTESSVTNGQARITGFKVAYMEEGGEPEELDIWVPDTLGVSEVLAMINDTLRREEAAKSHFMKGVLYGDPFEPLENNFAFWMYDLENEEDTVEAFNMKKDKWHAFANLDEAQEMIQEGDTVLIYGDAFTNYTDKQGKIFPETTSGYLAQILGKGVRVTMNFDSAYVDYSFRSEEADFLFTGEEDTLRIEALPIPVISKFASFYRMESATYGDVELNNVSLKVTYVGLTEEGAHIYSVVLKGYAAEDGMLHAFKGNVVFTSNDEDFGGYDDGRLIPRMTVARAIQEGLNGSTEKVYVYGYCSNIRRQYNQPNNKGVRYKNAEFYLSDDPECREETGFEAYGCTAVEEKDTLVVVGQLYYVFGELSYFATANLVEIGQGGIYNPVDALPENILDADPELEPDTVSAERAYQIGKELPEPEVDTDILTDKLYFIVGIVNEYGFEDYKTDYKNQTWFMANTAEYEGSMIKINRAKPSAEDPAKVGDKMGVLSKINKYHGVRDDGSEFFSISTVSGAKAVHTDIEIPDDVIPEAIPEVLMDASKVRSIKTIEDGQIVVIKNGVKYNVLGTRL